MSAEGIIREAAAACEYARRYGCTISVEIGPAHPFRAAIHVHVTPQMTIGDALRPSLEAGAAEPAESATERLDLIPRKRTPVRDRPQA